MINIILADKRYRRGRPAICLEYIRISENSVVLWNIFNLFYIFYSTRASGVFCKLLLLFIYTHSGSAASRIEY